MFPQSPLGLLTLLLELRLMPCLLLSRDSSRVLKFGLGVGKRCRGGFLRADASVVGGSEGKNTGAEDSRAAKDCRDRLCDP
ncbi:hypothetical protein ACSW29_21980 [Rhodococcus sp. GB-02]